MQSSETLKGYIEKELNDSEFYMQLSEIAPDSESKLILTRMANSKAQQAKEFQLLYHGLTSNKYEPIIANTLQKKAYREHLNNRVIEESQEYNQYMKHYNAGRGIEDALLLSALFGAGNNSNLNSLLLLYLLGRN